MDQQQSYAIPVSQGTDVERATFIRKTYMHLALAVLAFVGVEALLLSIPAVVKLALSLTVGWRWLIMLGGFMFVTSLAESWAHKSTNKTSQYGALGIYVLAQAFIFIPLMYIAMARTGDLSIIGMAGVITLGLFTGLSAIALFTKKDFSFLRSALMMGGFIAMGLIVASIAFGFSLGLWFSFAMVAFAGISILYQTSKIVHQYNSEQYVAASLGLFASFMLLLWYVLQIVLSFTSSD